jgi:hypothetical protein
MWFLKCDLIGLNICSIAQLEKSNNRHESSWTATSVGRRTVFVLVCLVLFFLCMPCLLPLPALSLVPFLGCLASDHVLLCCLGVCWSRYRLVLAALSCLRPDQTRPDQTRPDHLRQSYISKCQCIIDERESCKRRTADIVNLLLRNRERSGTTCACE